MKAHAPMTLAALLVVTSGAKAQVPPAGPGWAAPPGGAPPTFSNPAPARPSAGGLTAPGPIAGAERGRPSDTEEHLEESASGDSGRGLTWLWFDAEGGYQHMGLETFAVDRSNLTAGLVPAEASGPFAGAGLGLQLLFFRIGPRVRYGMFPDWRALSVGGEVGWRLPLGFLEPHFEIGGGYVALGNLDVGGLASLSKQAEIHGGYGRVGAGLDVFLGRVVSLGPFASWELMGLTRPGVSEADLDANPGSGLSELQKAAAALEGSGYGSSASLGVRLGLSL